ncbi:MAG: hypothetical protein P8124_06775 [Gammaproteobacteria bacterium]
MKRTAFVAAALVAVLVGVPRPAHADGDDAGAAALGFFLGAMVAPPAVVYERPPRVIVRGPGRDYDRYRRPPVYYYQLRDYPRHGWHERRHHRHRHWQQYRHPHMHRWHHRDDD